MFYFFLFLYGALVGYLIYMILLFRRTGVPYVATRKKLLPMIFSRIPLNSDSVVYDLGSGMGNFLFALEKHKSVKKLVGFELSSLYYFLSRLRAVFYASRVEFRRGDFMDVDLGEADVLYLFLTPPVMKDVEAKLKSSAKPGALVVTLGCQLSGFEPFCEVTTDPAKEKSSKIYFYEISSSVSRVRGPTYPAAG